MLITQLRLKNLILEKFNHCLLLKAAVSTTKKKRGSLILRLTLTIKSHKPYHKMNSSGQVVKKPYGN
jgi:hypothetical protein